MGESTDNTVVHGSQDAWVDAIARRFHEEYERLASEFGYDTRPESAVPWEDVPQANKHLMRAVVATVLYKAADPHSRRGHARGCWVQAGGPCDCTASDGDHFKMRRKAPGGGSNQEGSSG